MRAALLESERHLTLIETEEPTLQGAGQVLIQVKAVGVCGSEVHAFEGTHPRRKAPVILGHEMAGVISAVGGAVTGLRVGERVIVEPQWPCGECHLCRAGDINLCPSKKMLGTPLWPGAFGEYIVVPQEAVFHLPDHLSFEQGCLAEPLTVAVHVLRRIGLQAGESVVILGTGSIGGMLSGASRALGAEPVVAADVHQHCLDAAVERLGASHAVLLPDEGLADRVRDLTGGKGADVVAVAADDVTLVNQAIDMAARRGRIALVALLTHAPLQFRAHDMITKELSMVGSFMSNHQDVQLALDLTASGRVDVEGILTHVLPIEEAQRGLELAQSKDDGAIKVLLSFS